MKPLSAYTPYKSLGTIQGICKKQDDQFEVQLAKATCLTRVLACSHAVMYRENVHSFIEMQSLLPVLRFPLE